MNEHEIRRALAGAAAPVPEAGPDPARLRAALVHADRMKTIRMTMAVGAVTLVATVGIFFSQARETAAPVDVVDTPEAPTPQPLLPAINDGSTETSTTTTAPSTTTTVPKDAPDHLASSPTTTAAPVRITTTTAPPATTAPPPSTTTAPPAVTAPPTTTAPPPTTTVDTGNEFTAQARYGSCEEDPPYDEYSGTAAPGATITVTSAYSSPALVTADGNGDWLLRVEFPGAPANEHFDVTVGDGADSAVFDFVHTV